LCGILRFAGNICAVDPRVIEPFQVCDGAAAFVLELNSVHGCLHNDVCLVLSYCFIHCCRTCLYTDTFNLIITAVKLQMTIIIIRPTRDFAPRTAIHRHSLGGVTSRRRGIELYECLLVAIAVVIIMHADIIIVISCCCLCLKILQINVN